MCFLLFLVVFFQSWHYLYMNKGTKHTTAMKKFKNAIHIIFISVLIYLCYQMHEITVGIERLVQQQYQYEQVTKFGTLCNIEHFTKDLEQ